MTVAESYRRCEQIARKEAKNFYYSFLLLDKQRRLSMCAIYAFMRYCDDLSDAEGIDDRAGAIACWRADLDRAFAGDMPDHALWPAFIDTVSRYKIPQQYFYDMIAGVTSDLEPRPFETYEELRKYCYQVASVVGLTTIHVFGFTDPRALPLAEACGVAFQLTNILRDVREDAENGRVYLPQEDLRRFRVAEPALRASEVTEDLRELLKFEAGKARSLYEESSALVPLIDAGSRGSLRAMIGIYRRLHERIEEARFEVLKTRIRVPTWEKLWILVRSWR